MTVDEVIARIRRALMLEPAAFEEVRDDTNFTLVSIGSAGIAVLLAAIGAWLFGETVLDPAPGLGFVDTVIFGTIFTVVLFLIGVAVIYLIWTRALRVRPPDRLRLWTGVHRRYLLLHDLRHSLGIPERRQSASDDSRSSGVCCLGDAHSNHFRLPGQQLGNGRLRLQPDRLESRCGDLFLTDRSVQNTKRTNDSSVRVH